jgi:hypothetical protein
MQGKGIRAWGLLAACALLAALSLATEARRVHPETGAKMTVSGRITIEADGSVSAWELDQRDTMPGEVAELLDQQLAQWRFEPVVVDGRAVRGKARMRARVNARPLGDGSFGIYIADASFGRDALTREEWEALGQREPQTSRVIAADPLRAWYPREAMIEGAEGSVFLTLRVNREGGVDDVVVRQVELEPDTSARRVDHIRDAMAKVTADTARGWKFKPPTTGRLADAPYWSVGIEVRYLWGDDKDRTQLGRWYRYIPGPVAPVPWDTEPEGRRIGYAQSPGELQTYGSREGPRLLTPLGEP